MAQQLPKGSAQLVLWFKGTDKPLAWLTREHEAKNAQDAFNAGNEFITFNSWPNDTGSSSESLFLCSELRGVTVEVPVLQLVGV